MRATIFDSKIRFVLQKLIDLWMVLQQIKKFTFMKQCFTQIFYGKLYLYEKLSITSDRPLLPTSGHVGHNDNKKQQILYFAAHCSAIGCIGTRLL